MERYFNFGAIMPSIKTHILNTGLVRTPGVDTHQYDKDKKEWVKIKTDVYNWMYNPRNQRLPGINDPIQNQAMVVANATSAQIEIKLNEQIEDIIEKILLEQYGITPVEDDLG